MIFELSINWKYISKSILSIRASRGMYVFKMSCKYYHVGCLANLADKSTEDAVKEK
jgi:hypothetical protein